MTIFNNKDHHRRSIRLREFDYTTPGSYFITVCAFNQNLLFGKIVDGNVSLNEYGNIVMNEWLKTPQIRPYVQLDEFIVMPNHIHGILILTSRTGLGHGTPCPYEEFGVPTRNSIPSVIRAFKSAVARQINLINKTPGNPVWQRNYYEHMIRNENSLNILREYISQNPEKWNINESADYHHNHYGF